MPKRGKSLKTIEKEKKARLAGIAYGENKIEFDSKVKVSEDKILNDLNDLKKRYSFKGDEYIFVAEKNELLKEIDSMSDPEIFPMPEFLTNPEKTEERQKAIEKLKYLLKRRFALITIADILETNDYSKLDEIIERKDETYKAVEKYSGEGSENPVRLFSGFKKTVGDEYATVYAEQEERVRALLNILYDGTYFKEAENRDEKLELYLEDMIANIIDHPGFNLACQIETSFVLSEMKKAEETLSELSERAELATLIQELKEKIRIIEERSHAYNVIDRLMSGQERKIIPKKDEEERE